MRYSAVGARSAGVGSGGPDHWVADLETRARDSLWYVRVTVRYSVVPKITLHADLDRAGSARSR